MSELRVRLAGPTASLGAVAAADVARLIVLVERATARAASVVLGQPKVTTGRYRDAIEQATRFRLRAVEAGSVVPVLELPEMPPPHGDTLDMEAATLGESAVSLLMDALRGDSEPHPVVAKGLLDLAVGMHVGDRYEYVGLDAMIKGHARRHACVDGGVRARLRDYVVQGRGAASRPDVVAGTLVEADFEKRTARLHTATQPSVQVDFPEDLDDEVYAALRQPTTLRGEVAYDPTTHMARTVAVTAIDHGAQLPLAAETEEYWSERSFEDLARRQGTGQPLDPDSLYDPEATDAERDAFMAAIADLR